MSVAPAPASAETTSPLDGTTVGEAMHTGVMTCAPDAALTAVAHAMSEHRVHCLIVEGVANDIHGEHLSWMVLSDLDLVRAAHSGLQGLTAAAVARTEPLSIESTATLRQAARMMDEHHVSHLIATEGEVPAGVISSIDVAACAARS